MQEDVIIKEPPPHECPPLREALIRRRAGARPPPRMPLLWLWKKNIFQGKSNTKHAYSIVLPLVQVSTFVSNCSLISTFVSNCSLISKFVSNCSLISTFVSNCSLISTFVSNCSLISTFVSNLGFPNEAEHPYYKRGGFQLLSGPHQVGHTVGEETLRGGADEQCSSDYTTLNIYRGTV